MLKARVSKADEHGTRDAGGPRADERPGGEHVAAASFTKMIQSTTPTLLADVAASRIPIFVGSHVHLRSRWTGGMEGFCYALRSFAAESSQTNISLSLSRCMSATCNDGRHCCRVAASLRCAQQLLSSGPFRFQASVAAALQRHAGVGCE